MKDIQFTQTMHLQFLESGLGDEMVNGLDEGWMRVSSIMDSGAAESERIPQSARTILAHEQARSIELLAAND